MHAVNRPRKERLLLSVLIPFTVFFAIYQAYIFEQLFMRPYLEVTNNTYISWVYYIILGMLSFSYIRTVVTDPGRVVVEKEIPPIFKESIKQE